MKVLEHKMPNLGVLQNQQKRNLTYFTTVDQADVREVKELLRLR